MTRLWNISFVTAWSLAGALAASSAQAVPQAIQLPAETVELRPSPLSGFKIATQKCAICHSADYIAYQPPGMNLTQWTAEMKKMQHTYGAPIDDVEIKLLGIYLAATYGDASSVSAEDRALQAPPTVAPSAEKASAATAADAGKIDVQALLASNACLSCHAIDRKVVGPAYHDVALKYKDDAQAVGKLETSIRQGGAGKWGQVPMPPFAGLNDAQLKALAEFVLKQ